MENRPDLESLFATVSLKREMFDALGACNTYGLSVTERVALDVKYERARRELDTAQAVYTAALRKTA